MDGDDVRVLERRAGLRLAVQAVDELLTAELGPDRLHGDAPLQRRVHAPVDLAHAARSQHGHHLELTDTGAGAEQHRLKYRPARRAG